MNTIKQALILLLEKPIKYFLLGVCTYFMIFLAQKIPVISGFLSVICLLFNFFLCTLLRQDKAFNAQDMSKKLSLPLIVVAALLTPSAILAGSAWGMMDRPQDSIQALSSTLALLLFCIYFFSVGGIAMLWSYQTTQSILKSLDRVVVGSLKMGVLYAQVILFFSCALVLALYLKGLGLIILAPLFFITMELLSFKHQSLPTKK